MHPIGLAEILSDHGLATKVVKPTTIMGDVTMVSVTMAREEVAVEVAEGGVEGGVKGVAGGADDAATFER
jgi:hypothetical protein